MGSGASKKSRPGKHRDAAVTAEVVIPGQTRPIKVKGHVRSGSPGSLEGGAKLTEVAPSKYNVKIGNKDIGTFDVPDSDFASYLRHAASLTVTNIKAVDGEDDFTPAKRHLRIPLARQASVISAYNYSDDEDWEDVAQSLDRSESSYSNEEQQKEAAKERRSRIKQAIREKREKLSQQEYQQMIANHKQEMELMAILREREKERHQMKLGSKVAERKRRREARLAEKRGQEKPLAVKEDAPAVTEKKVIKYQDVDKTEKELLEQLGSDVEHGGHATQRQKKSFLNKLAASKSNKVLTVTELQQLEAELEDKQREFNTVLKEKKLQISDEDYKKLIAEHKLQLGRIQEKLELQRSRQRQAMLDKLAARKKMREQGEEDKNSLSAIEIKELQLALNHRAMAFRDELKDTRSQLSAEECQRMIEGHRREMETMQEQLDRERERMRRELMEKLENRRKRSKEQLVEDMEPCFSLEELKQLQLTIDVKNTSEKQEIASRKNRVSSAEHRKLLDQHQQEIEEMERRLEEERDVSRRRLEGKLAERRNRRPKSGLICGDERIPDKESGPYEVQSLQEEIYSEEKRFREEVEEKRSGMSEEEYQKLLEQHKREMERLQQKLQDSQERQKQRWQDKLALRRRKRERAADRDEGFTAVLADSDTEHSVTKTTGQGIEATYEESSVREKAGDSPVQVVQESSKGQRLKLESEADFVSVMALLDKIKDDHTTSITEDDLNQLEQDLKNYSQTVHESLDAKRGIFPDEELDLMISEHRRNMETMANRLENQRLRIEEKLNRKLRSRQARALSDYTEGAADVREAEILYQEGLVSSGEEDDEFDDLSDIGVTVPQLATTQFWTTPIQYMDVLVVPLADEYPVQKKSELYTDPSIFRDLDAHAIRGCMAPVNEEDRLDAKQNFGEQPVGLDGQVTLFEDTKKQDIELDSKDLEMPGSTDGKSGISENMKGMHASTFASRKRPKSDYAPLNNNYMLGKTHSKSGNGAHSKSGNGDSGYAYHVDGQTFDVPLDSNNMEGQQGIRKNDGLIECSIHEQGDHVLINNHRTCGQDTSYIHDKGDYSRKVCHSKEHSGHAPDLEHEYHKSGYPNLISPAKISSKNRNSLNDSTDDTDLEADEDLREYEQAILAILEDEEEDRASDMDLATTVAPDVDGREVKSEEARDNPPMTDAEIQALEDDLEVYELTVTSELKQEWQLCRDEELDLLMLEHCQNVSMMRKKIRAGKRRLWEIRRAAGKVEQESEDFVKFQDFVLQGDGECKVARVVHQD